MSPTDPTNGLGMSCVQAVAQPSTDSFHSAAFAPGAPAQHSWHSVDAKAQSSAFGARDATGVEDPHDRQRSESGRINDPRRTRRETVEIRSPQVAGSAGWIASKIDPLAVVVKGL